MSEAPIIGTNAGSGGSSTPADNSVTSAKIVDGTIVNADINASAAIALSKLAAGTNGDVIGTSNGAIANVKRPGYYTARTGAIAETWGTRVGKVMNGAVAPLTSQQLYLHAIELYAGQVIGHITWLSGATTALGTPTHQWFCLCDSNRNLVAITTDDTNTAWGTSVEKTLAIATIASGASSTYTVPSDGLYYMGIMLQGGTMPNMTVINEAASTASGLAPILHGNSTTGLSTPSTFATQYAAITANTSSIYGYVSA